MTGREHLPPTIEPFFFLDALRDPALIISAEGTIARANKLAADLFGYDVVELTGRDVGELIPAARERYSPEAEDATLNPSGSAKDNSPELNGIRRDGLRIPVGIHYGPFESGSDNYTLLTVLDRAVTTEKAKLRNRLVDELLADLGRSLGATLDEEEFWGDFGRRLSEIIPTTRMTIAIPIDDDGDLQFVYRTGEWIKGLDTGDRILRHGSLSGYVLETGNPILGSGSDLDRYVDRFPAFKNAYIEGIRSIAAVALPSGDQNLGVLVVVAEEEDAYSSEDMALLAKCAPQLGGALRILRDKQEQGRTAREEMILWQISQVVTSTDVIGDIYDELADQIRTLIPFDRIVISTVHPDINLCVDRYVAGEEIAEGIAGTTYELESSATWELLKETPPQLLTGNTHRQFTERFSEARARLDAGFVSLIAAPLRWKDQPVGILLLRSRDPAAFHHRHLRLVQRIASGISGALAVTSQLEQTIKTADQLNLLAEIGRVVSSSLPFEAKIDDLSSLVGALVPHERFVISTIDHENHLVVDHWVSGESIAGWQVGDVHPLDGTVAEQVLRSRDSVYRFEGETQLDGSCPVEDQYRTHTGFNALIITPLIFNDHILGTMNVRHRRLDAFDHDDVDLLRKVAFQIDGAVVNALLKEDIEKEARQQASLAAIGRAVAQDLDLASIYSRVADELENLIPHDRLAITLLDPNGNKLRLVFARGIGAAADRMGAAIPPREPEGWAWQDTEASTPGGEQRRQRMLDLGLNNWIEAPLGSQAEGPIGYLSLRSLGNNSFSHSDLDLLRQVAFQVTPTIQAAKAHHQERQLAAERTHIAEIEAEAREMRAAADERTRFLSMVSHELKTPLTSVLAFSDMLSRNRDDVLEKKHLDQIQIIQKNGRRLNLLIDDLLDVSKLEGGTLKIEISEFPLAEFFGDLASSFAPLLRARKQELEIESPPEKPWIRADRGRIYQVVSNLLNNASKYSPERTSIRVEWAINSGVLRLSVVDEGPGLEEDDAEKIFRPFYRVDSELTRSVPGTGIGLALSRAIAELHEGRLFVESSPGSGCTFTLEIPGVSDGPSPAHLALVADSNTPVLHRSRLASAEA